MIGLEARRAAIAERVAREGEATVEELARVFDVNAMTIRRDLDALGREGRLRRTHGGAMAARAGVVEFAFQERCQARAKEKRAIAARAAALVRPGMTVSLDTGTTTLEVARCLADTGDLTVLTTSLAIASALHAKRNLTLVLLGGMVSRTKPELYGPLAEENLKTFRVDVAFLGADAVTSEGLFTTDMQTAAMCRAMIAQAGQAVLVADSGKFGRTAFVRYAAFQDVDVVVTDRTCPARVRTWLRKKAGNALFA